MTDFFVACKFCPLNNLVQNQASIPYVGIGQGFDIRFDIPCVGQGFDIKILKLFLVKIYLVYKLVLLFLSITRWFLKCNFLSYT